VSRLSDSLYHQGGVICSAAPAALPLLVDLVEQGAGTRDRLLRLIGKLAGAARTAAPRHVDEAWPDAWRVEQDARRRAVALWSGINTHCL
jgi:hypothetical protein